MGPLAQKIARWGQALLTPEQGLHERYAAFRTLLAADEQSLLLITELEEIFAGQRQVDPARTRWLCGLLSASVADMTGCLAALNPEGYPTLPAALERVRAGLSRRLPAEPPPAPSSGGGPLLLPLRQAPRRPELCGGKAENLALAGQAGLSVPPGVVVTTAAFRRFLSYGRLRPRLDRLLRQVDLARPERLGPLCAGMRALVLGAPLPRDLAQALRRAAKAPGLRGGLLAVRSSALAEDGENSFAGQYESLLNVAPQDLPDAYRQVLASKYRPRAVAYRLRLGLADEAAPMAVLLLPMIQAAAAGVLHTSEPRPDGAGNCAVVFALPGLGEELVSGRAEPRVLRLARRLPAEILSASGGARVELPPAALSELLLSGLVLQSSFGRPQELEWAVDRQGRLFLLQCRADKAAPPEEPEAAEARERSEVVRPDARTLAEDLHPVAAGVGCGPVFHLEPGAGLARVPEGCVLAVDSLSPALSRCVDRVAAVVARSGSRASHFGSVAREAGLPVLSGLDEPRTRLPAGLLVTVDADACAVLAGCPDNRRSGPEERRDRERRRLRGRFLDLARQTCHLGLTDPEAPDFAPEGCGSLHDLVRFCHEKAVAEMAGLDQEPGGGLPGLSQGMGKARRLRTGLPLSLYLLDLGGGLDPGADARQELEPEAVRSAPLQALWRGLAHSGEVWTDTGFSCDWEEFDRISAGIFRKDSRLLASLALVSADYLHLLVRFGYHFAVLDCLCGARAEANYLHFRFKGGGGLPEQRRLRILFLTRVLGDKAFAVRVRGDMLEARLARLEAAELRRALVLLGRLLVRSRRLDLALADEAQAGRLAEDFLCACGRDS